MVNHYEFHCFFIILLLLQLLVTVTYGFNTTNTTIPGCPSFDCGNGVKIQYPFWVPRSTTTNTTTSETVPYFCGYPDLKVTCEGNVSTFGPVNDNFTVTGIDYKRKAFFLVDSDVIENRTCPIVRRVLNTTNTTVLDYTPEVVNLTFFYNCSFDHLFSTNNIPCLDNKNNNNLTSYVFVGPVSEENSTRLSGDQCKGGSAVAPVLYLALRTENIPLAFGDVMKSGFVLEWTSLETDNCRKCERSGGNCGYLNNTGYGSGPDFACFCKDGLSHSGSCDGGLSTWKKLLIGVLALLGLVIFVGSCWLWCRRREKHAESHKEKEQEQVLFSRNEISSGPLASTEFFFMGIATLQSATENFSIENKLGEGGFGPVYRGTLPDGKQIAVKRLSSNSTQGFMEFKNEVKSIAKLQHRNLVRLLGCCDDRNEKLLVYEYLPNQSLNYFIFDSEKRSFLDWSKRIRIIIGITRGLIYLHEDSRLKIIHRDLKPGNILLDQEMNPKISDFGLARIFSSDENEANTNRIVGTYGYMAPEFAMDGMFSVKSDVYSFGVLLLEIISGNKNGRSHFLQFERSLPDHAWELWEEGKGVELIDKLMVFSCPVSEILRCIHVGLLCVQENAVDRPTMSMVLRVLQNEQLVLMEPKKPPSFVRSLRDQRSTSSSSKIPSDNGLTLTSVPGR